MDSSRKRKLSEGADTSSARARVQATAGGDESLKHLSGPSALEAAGIRQRDGHRFSDIDTSGQSRAHFGDSYTFSNWGKSPSNENEQAERQRRRNFMEALSFDRMDFRRAAIDPTCGQTCQWIFEHEQYLRWCDSSARDSHGGFFWIKGKPGSGKSTLMKCIVEHLWRRTECTTISFFFNARGGPLERTIEGLYRSLLHQTLEQFPELLASTRLPSEPRKGQTWEIIVVRDLFRQAISRLGDERLVLVIDALDECDEDDIRDMLILMSGLAQSVQSLRICFASRHYPRISIQYCEELVLESLENHDQDVLEYVLRELTFNAEQRTSLVQQIREKARGVFMWVVLVVRILNKQFDRGLPHAQLLASINSLPDALDALIRRIISGDGPDAHLLPALLWTLAGHDSMSLREMYIGILLGAGNLSSPLGDVPADESTMERFIVHSSRGLVEEVWDPYQRRLHLQFIHESVRQHILAGNLGSLRPSLSTNVEANTHAMLGEWCLRYTQLRLSLESGYPINPASGAVAWGRLLDANRAKAAFPLLSYVFFSTFFHLERAFAGKAYDAKSLAFFPLHDWINISNIFCVGSQQRYLSTTSLLHILLESSWDWEGSTELLETLMELYCVESDTTQDNRYTKGTVDYILSGLLLGQGVNIYYGGEYGSPLIAAVSNGHPRLVEKLLRCGADPNIVRTGIGPSGQLKGSGKLALGVASSWPDAWERTHEIIKTLLTYGAKIDDTSGSFGSGLAQIASMDNVDDEDSPLSAGSDVDMSYLNLTLTAALEPRSSEDMIALLLGHWDYDGQ